MDQLSPTDDPLLNREAIRSGAIIEMIREAELRGLLRLSTQEERLASRRRVLEAADPRAPIWVFGYGSLMWNPAFEYADRETARLHGYHRRFCLWSPAGRGSPERPGLVLALEPGGCCHGVAFRIAPARVEEELDIIWAREMVAMSYRPRWVRIRTASGPVRAITFVIDRRHPRYSGRLTVPVVAATLAVARGPLGTAFDYLERTVAHLETVGRGDSHLEELLTQARRHHVPECTG